MAGKVAAGVFAVLMLVFVITSVDWSQVTGGASSTVGEIGGVKIPLRTYQQLVQQQMEGWQRENSRSPSAEEVEEIRNSVWEQLIQQQSLEAEYRRRGITVSTDEVAAAIENSPPNELLSAAEFQTDGQFDIQKYQRWLRSSAAEQVVPLLEAQYADQIKQSKLLRVVTGDIYLSDPALWQAWRDANEKVTIELAAIIPRNAVPDSAVAISDAEIRQYYDANKDDFKRPATAYLSYVQVLRFPDQSDTAAARARAETLRQEILAGAPFAEVAQRESSDSVSAAQGGDLGEFGRGTMDPAFERAAYSLPIGVVSEPVLSGFGYHLIKVEKRAGGKVTARHILIPVEITGSHRDALDARADTLEALAAERLEPSALDSAARSLGLTIGQANPLQKGSRVQVGFQVVPDAGVWAFQAKVGETSRIVEVSYAYFLFRLDSLTPEGIPPFEKVKDAAAFAARNVKKRERALAIATNLVKRVGEGSTLDQAATALALPHQRFGPFTRVQPPFPNTRVIGAAFGLEPGKTSDVIDTEEGIYVLRVISRTPADSAEFVKGVDEYRARQIQAARQDRVRSYLTALVKTVKVEDNRAALFRTEAQAEEAASRQPRS